MCSCVIEHIFDLRQFSRGHTPQEGTEMLAMCGEKVLFRKEPIANSHACGGCVRKSLMLVAKIASHAASQASTASFFHQKF